MGLWGTSTDLPAVMKKIRAREVALYCLRRTTMPGLAGLHKETHTRSLRPIAGVAIGANTHKIISMSMPGGRTGKT